MISDQSHSRESRTVIKKVLAPSSSPRQLELRSYTAREVAVRNVLYRNPLSAIVQLVGMRAVIDLSHTSYDVDQLVFVSFAIGDDPGWIAFPGGLIKHLLEKFDSKLAASDPSSPYAALGIECVLAPLLDTLEKKLGISISIEGVFKQAPQQSGEAIRAGVNLDIQGVGHFPGQVRLPLDAASRLAELSNARPATSQNKLKIDFPLVVCAGATTLTVAELRSLGSGDVIMMEHSVDPRMETAIAQFAETWVFPVSLKQGSTVVDAPYQSVRTSTWGWCMEDSDQKNSLESNESSIDKLPVHLVFELGRISLTLEQVKSYQKGTVIPLDRKMASAVDIVANGRRIGRGTIVRIGDSLGVEIVRISSGD